MERGKQDMSKARPEGRIRLLPVVVFIVMLAFSVRLADVVADVSHLTNEAEAAGQEATPPPAVPSQAASGENQHDLVAAPAAPMAVDQAPAQSGDTQDTMLNPAPADDSQKSMKVDPTSKLVFDAKKEEGKDKVDWRDASDTDIDYSSVRVEMFEDLARRRKALDQREKEINAREALLKAGEQELERKYQELTQLRQKIENLLQTQSEEEKARVESLVKIYEGMKPKDAARIFDTLDLDILVNVMGHMQERKLAPIMSSMNPERARTVTIMLAKQKQLPELPK